MTDRDSLPHTGSAASAEPLVPSIWKRTVESVFLHRHLAQARARRFLPTQPGFAELQLGLAAVRDAHQLANSAAGRETALLLYRSGIRLLLRATLLRHGLISRDATDAEVWARASELSAWSALLTEAQLADAKWMNSGVMNEQGESYLASLTGAERERAVQALRAYALRLAAPLEEDVTRVSRLLWTRRLRLATALLVLAAIAGPRLFKLFAPVNLALHRPVEVSDRQPMYGVDPSQVVDGDQLNLGFHTTSRPNASLTIDLGRVLPLSRVEVYNRPDCCQERAVPLDLQLSTDGVHFETLARRDHVFQHWTVPLNDKPKARYVRLLHTRHEFFHLSEVEVY